MQDAQTPSPQTGSPVEPLSRPAAVSGPLLPGALKSTEFWISIVVIAAIFAESISGSLPAQWAAPLMVVTGGLYKALRTFLKLRAAQFASDAVIAQIESQASRATVPAPAPESSPER